MAKLSTAERQDAMRRFVKRAFGDVNATAYLDCDESQILINALDDFIDAQGAAMNTAIPEPVRSKAQLTEKALALSAVAMKRAGII